MSDLIKLRNQIDKIDQELLELLSRRVAVVKKIGAIKKLENLKVEDLKRKQVVKRNYIQLAKKHGMSKLFAEKLYEAIYEEAVRAQC